MPPITANHDIKKNSFSKWLTGFLIFCVTLITPLAVAPSLYAGLSPLEDEELQEVWGAAGIMTATKNVQIFHHIDSIRYCAPGDPSYPSTDPRSASNGYIEFQDFMMHGNGDVARFNYDFGSVTESGLIITDVAEPEVARANDWSGSAFNSSNDATNRGMVKIESVTEWDQELRYSIGNISLYDPIYAFATPIDLGAATIGLIDMPSFSYIYSPRIGGTGVDFQHTFQMTIDQIAYEYNTGCDLIDIGPIYIGESFSDLAGDDPRFPSTWKPNQATPLDFGEFQIGDLYGDITDGKFSNPAGIDVGEADLDCAGPDPVLGAVNLRLPMNGSIRFENVAFDGTDFGPGAIDGIQVHRLNLFLIP